MQCKIAYKSTLYYPLYLYSRLINKEKLEEYTPCGLHTNKLEPPAQAVRQAIPRLTKISEYLSYDGSLL